MKSTYSNKDSAFILRQNHRGALISPCSKTVLCGLCLHLFQKYQSCMKLWTTRQISSFCPFNPHGTTEQGHEGQNNWFKYMFPSSCLFPNPHIKIFNLFLTSSRISEKKRALPSKTFALCLKSSHLFFNGCIFVPQLLRSGDSHQKKVKKLSYFKFPCHLP